MIDRKLLRSFVGKMAEEPTPIPALVPQAELAERPEAWGVLYASPNASGSSKNCSNCVFWSTSQQCAIHAPQIYVSAAAVCGYHISGNPTDVRPDLPGLEPIEPEYSGLVTVPMGTSCESCRWYTPEIEDRGLCRAVDTPEGMPAPVEALGCCARWEIIR